MNRKTFVKRISFLVVVITAFAFVLAGCRPSPALEQIIYTKDATVVDVARKKYEQDKRHEDRKKNEDLNGEEADEDSGSVNSEEVNTNGGGSEEHQAADLGEGTGGTGSGAEVQYSENGDSEKTASGTGRSGGKTKAKNKKQKDVEDGDAGLSEYKEKETKEKGKKESDNKDEDKKTDDNDDPIDNPDDNPGDNPGEEDNPGGDGGDEKDKTNRPERDRKTIDYGGVTQEVPTNVDKVAACGYAAQLVEMLGGSGRLAGSNELFTGNWLAPAVIGDLEEVSTWWNGDGSYGIGGTEFQALLDMDTEVLIEISGDLSVDDNQLQTLKDAGISYVVVPRPDSAENLINGAKIIATVLGDDGNGGSAMNIAKNYESWINSVKAEVNAGDSYVYSTLASGWDDSVAYTFTQGNYSLLPEESGGSSGMGYGTAVGYSAKASVIVNEFMEAAGVIDEVSQTGSAVEAEEVYLTPMFHNLAPIYDGPYAAYNGSLPASVDWGLVHQNGEVITYLGDDNFQYVIAADNYTKSQIESSWYWQWHGEFRTSTGIFTAAYIPEGTSEVFRSSIGGYYQVLVNPSGLGSWITGSVDAPLEAYWLACYVRGDISESDLYSRIRDFYNTFYHVNLSDSEISEIFIGD